MYYRGSILTLMILVIHFNVFHACQKYRFVKEENVEFKNHVIKNMTTPYVEVCWEKCARILNCFSINARVNRFGMVECDLNNSSKKASPGSLVPTQGSDYYQMRNVSDCGNYECLWKEALADNMFLLNGFIIKMIKENKTWADARAHCQSLGGDLLSISSSEENEFMYRKYVKNEDFSNSKPHPQKANNLNGMVQYLRLDGNDPNVTLRGYGARYEDVDGEKALYLPMTAYAEVPPVVFNPEGFTFMLWIKLANKSSTRDLVYSDWSSPSFNFYLNIRRDSSSMLYSMRSQTEEAHFRIRENSVIVNGGWFQCTVRMNKTEQKTWLLFNGKDGLSKALSFTADIKAASHPHFHLGVKGKELDDTLTRFHGYLKDIKVFNKSLTNEEIQTSMYWSESGPWIGLNAHNSSTFEWSDGTNTHFMALPSYNPNPALSGRKCVLLGKNGLWIDKTCHEAHPFICEIPQQ